MAAAATARAPTRRRTKMLTTNEDQALIAAAESLAFAPSDAEVRSVLVFDPAQEDQGYRLSLVKGLMIRLLQSEQRIQQKLVEAIRFIESQELFLADADADGNPFTSMSQYLPYLLKELKSQGYLDTPGVRQMR